RSGRGHPPASVGGARVRGGAGAGGAGAPPPRPPAPTELAELYGVPYEEGELERTVLAVERAGGRDWAQLQAADRMSRAMHELSRAIPDPEAAGGLLALAEFVTRRSN
ncbi:hypothetical protein ACFV1D_35015, partial [Streptomyces mirabilis]